jgi:hypothetical protein
LRFGQNTGIDVVSEVLLKAVYFSEVGIWIERKGILLGTWVGNKEVIELVYIGYMRGVYIGIGHMVES